MGKLVKLTERIEHLARRLGNVYDVKIGFIAMSHYINSCYDLVNKGIMEREAKAMINFDYDGITKSSADLLSIENNFNHEFPNSFFGEVGGLAYCISRIKRVRKVCEHFESIDYKLSILQ
ncbi:hypothetical protein HYU07_00835 [Candidatus Woesearchaeota archaeon]|nr:hypothetical protein [Candidatus Woesearchaeota archaeon]